MTKLWEKTLGEIGEERFDDALTRALEVSPHRPCISEIRRFAGVVTEVPVEREAMDYFRSILEAMRKHGWQLKPILGEVLNDGRDDKGVIMQVPNRAPSTNPPTYPQHVVQTMRDMGFGSVPAGLEAISAHPSLPWNRRASGDTVPPGIVARNALELERRWMDAYKLQAVHKTFRSVVGCA